MVWGSGPLVYPHSPPEDTFPVSAYAPAGSAKNNKRQIITGSPLAGMKVGQGIL